MRAAAASVGRLAGRSDRDPHGVAETSTDDFLDLAGRIGNHAFTRLVGGRQALQRQGHGATAAPPAPTAAPDASGDAARIEGWAAAQDDWGVLEENRAQVEAAQPGSTVRLTGKGDVTFERTDESRAAARRGIRHRLMEMVYEWRQPLVDELGETRAASTRLDVQHKMRERLRGLVAALRKGLPDSERFEYPKGAQKTLAGKSVTGEQIIASVLAALQLEGEGAAENVLAGQDFDKAKGEALAAIGTNDPTTEWCGAFAYAQLAQAGLGTPSGAGVRDNPLAGTGEKPGHLDAWFQYRQPVEVKVGDNWKDLRKYHEERGSVRLWQVLPASGADYEAQSQQFEHGPRGGQLQDLDKLDIQPGDIVVKDVAVGTYADHITMCRTYDREAKILHTIGGNEGAAHPVHGSRAIDLKTNPAPKIVAKGASKAERVYAVGRFSIVDFEVHEYRKPGGGTTAAAKQ